MSGGISHAAIAAALRSLAARNGPRRAIDASVLGELVSRGLAGEGEAGPVATPAGLAWLRRHLAGGDDAFAAQHQARAEAVVQHDLLGRQTVTVNQDESPLAWLRRHKGKDGRPMVDAAEFTAGERLRSDYTRGQLMPRVTANWTASVAAGRRDGGAGGMAELTEAAIGARRRVEKALAAVGPEFAGVLVDFCCFLKGLEEIERERSWPARSAKLVIRLALSALARHYGLATAASGRAHGRVLHWGADDYRPSL
jgi:hypothetical protein